MYVDRDTLQHVDECAHTHTHKSHITPSHNLLPNPLAPVIQIYELPLATICYNLQQSYYTSHALPHTHTLAYI